MSSISVYELKKSLESYPDDYEVIMRWKWKENEGCKESIAYINGIKLNEQHKEIELLN